MCPGVSWGNQTDRRQTCSLSTEVVDGLVVRQQRLPTNLWYVNGITNERRCLLKLSTILWFAYM